MERLHEGSRSLIYRCRRAASDESVVLKLAAPSAGAARNRALYRERDMLRAVGDCDGVARLLGFEADGPQCGLLLEDVRSASLDASGLAGALSPSAWLAMALSLTRLLGELHARGIVHNDLNPANILVNAGGAAVKLIDLASAVVFDEQGPVSSGLRALQGPIAYMSPERTGRVGCPVGPRSDLYSLGVVLFEQLTGQLPFQQDDPGALVHAHVARRAPLASEVAGHVPEQLSAILQQLLAKDPDERYPSAMALDTALRGASVSASEPPVAGSGRRRVASVLRRTGRLVGRSDELAALAAMMDRSRSGTRVAVLTGPAGVGKTTLARALIESVTAKGGYFGAGRFDADSPSAPHRGLAGAIDALVTRALAESDARLKSWSTELEAALGGTSHLLVDLWPRAGQIVRPTGPSAAVGQVKTQLSQAIITFLEQNSVLGGGLGVFLDDVQWANSDSLRLLEDVIAGCRSAPVFFLLAVRGSAHPELDAALERQRQRGPVERLDIEPLGRVDVAELIADVLGCPATESRELAELVSARTHGNPLHARAFLQALQTEGLTASGLDVERINRLGVTENVGSLLAESLSRLSPECHSTLAVAARIGSQFDADVLGRALGRPVDDSLAAAVAAGLVLPVRASGAPSPTLGAAARFAHDLVRQACLSALAEAKVPAVHAAIGRAIQNGRAPGALGSAVFDVARHLNRASPLLQSHAEQVERAELNLCAARAALARAAPADAIEFAQAGVSIVDAETWRDRYELARDLFTTAAEAAFETAEHDVLQRYVSELRAHARAAVDVSRAYWIQGRVLQAQSRSADAIDTYFAALAELGVSLERDPSPERVRLDRLETAALIERIGIDALGDRPACTSQPCALAAELLSKLVFFAYADVSPILPVVICRLVRLAIEDGVTAESANGYTFYGLLLALDGEREQASGLARAALRVAHRFEDVTILSQTYLYTSYLLLHWRMPLAELAQPLSDAYRHGVASGSPMNAACSATTLCICRFWAGEDLERLAADMRDLRTVIVRYRQGRILNWHEVLQQAIENLRTQVVSPTRLEGPIYDESQRYPEHQRQNDKTAIYNLNVARTLLAYVYGDMALALKWSSQNRNIPPLFSSSLWAVPVAFMDGLCLAASARLAQEPERSSLIAQGRAVLGKLSSLVEDNPRDVLHKVQLLEAELASASGALDAARAHYARATEQVVSAGSLLDQALTWEAAARFELRAGDPLAARRPLRRAHRAYLRWGALGKASALERELPNLIQGSQLARVNAWPFNADERDFDVLDFANVLSASQALATEIRREGLLTRLMTLVLESAGAQAGYFLSRDGDEWIVEAARAAERGIAVHPPGTRLRRAPSLECAPTEAILNYVSRTNEALLSSSDATFEQLPMADRGAGRTGSILCFPVKYQNTARIIVYLENRLTRNAFNLNTLRVLEMLAAQAAVSLENARLYEELEQRVELRTRELRDKNEELGGALRRLMEIQGQLVTQEKLAALGSLAGGIAHEIKNPLNFIINFAESAARTAVELVEEVEVALPSVRQEKHAEVHELVDELQLALTKVVEHGHRATNIVNGMSLHARSGGDRTRAALNDLVRDALDMAQPSAAGAGDDVPIITDLDVHSPHVVAVVQDLTRVVLNLVSNAVYAVQRRREAGAPGYEPRVEVATRDVGNVAEIRVRDNGTGIPAAIREQIFLPFFTTKPTGHGTGLGLSISHDIVVRGHGGAINFETREGEFTEFVVTLPSPIVAQA